MTCREFVDFLMAYLDGELEPPRSSRFEAHLEACPACEAYLETYQETVALGRSVCDDLDGPVPPEAPDELVQAILDARQREA